MSGGHRKDGASGGPLAQHILMRSFVWLSIVLAGCGAARFRTEHVGTAQVVANAGSIPLGRGNYQMAMRFDIPRAQVVGWTVRCPGVECGTAVSSCTT